MSFACMYFWLLGLEEKFFEVRVDAENGDYGEVLLIFGRPKVLWQVNHSFLHKILKYQVIIRPW